MTLDKFDTGTPRNPFRDHTMRQQYAAAVFMYRTRHYNLFWPTGGRKSGSSMANFFWHGWDNLMVHQWDTKSKQMLGYAYWRAGRDLQEDSTRHLVTA